MSSVAEKMLLTLSMVCRLMCNTNPSARNYSADHFFCFSRIRLFAGDWSCAPVPVAHVGQAAERRHQLLTYQSA